MIDIVALGELLIDFACVQTDDDGYPTMAGHPGGAPANFLAALNAYGCKTAMLGKVGEDAFGEMLLGTLQKAGIETKGMVVDPAFFTTLAFVSFNAQGERSFSFARKPGADTQLRFEELDLSLIREAKAFHFGTLSLTDEPAATATKKAVDYAKQQGKLITFDPNLRKSLWRDLEQAKEAMLWGLQQADFVKISDEEAAFLWDCDAVTVAQKLLKEFGVKLALVTKGVDGAYIANASECAEAQCPKVAPIDTTGAGDICGGSAVSQILKIGKRPEALTQIELREIVAFATTAASLSTEKPGGISAIVPEKTVRARMSTC